MTDRSAHPANPDWQPTEGPGSGDDRYRFKPGDETCGPRRKHLQLVVDNTTPEGTAR